MKSLLKTLFTLCVSFITLCTFIGLAQPVPQLPAVRTNSTIKLPPSHQIPPPIGIPNNIPPNREWPHITPNFSTHKTSQTPIGNVPKNIFIEKEVKRYFTKQDLMELRKRLSDLLNNIHKILENEYYSKDKSHKKINDLVFSNDDNEVEFKIQLLSFEKLLTEKIEILMNAIINFSNKQTGILSIQESLTPYFFEALEDAKLKTSENTNNIIKNENLLDIQHTSYNENEIDKNRLLSYRLSIHDLIELEKVLQKSNKKISPSLTIDYITLKSELEAPKNSINEITIKNDSLYYYNNGIKYFYNDNMVDARKQFTKASSIGNIDAEFVNALTFARPAAEQLDTLNTLIWLTKAADHNHGNAQYILGLILMSGWEGVLVNESKAMRYLFNASENGVIEASQKFNQYCLSVYGIDSSKVRETIKHSGQFPMTMDEIFEKAINYIKGNGCPKDVNQATDLFAQAAKLGHPLSQYCLGICYANGQGVKKNKQTAISWYEQVCKNPTANDSLKTMAEDVIDDLSRNKIFFWIQKKPKTKIINE